jgi:hypothetical protein
VQRERLATGGLSSARYVPGSVRSASIEMPDLRFLKARPVRKF